KKKFSCAKRKTAVPAVNMTRGPNKSTNDSLARSIAVGPCERAGGNMHRALKAIRRRVANCTLAPSLHRSKGSVRRSYCRTRAIRRGGGTKEVSPRRCGTTRGSHGSARHAEGSKWLGWAAGLGK